MKRIIYLFSVIILLSVFSSCTKDADQEYYSNNEQTDIVSETASVVPEESVNVVRNLTAAEAKEKMETESDIVILDVRTQEEFDEGHIKNAVLLPDYEILEKASEIIPDKNRTVLVYCRSGRRSAAAAKELVSMGYSGVYDFGGIISWPYETEK